MVSPGPWTAMAVDHEDRLYVAERGTLVPIEVNRAGGAPSIARGTPIPLGGMFVWAAAFARDGAIWALDGQDHLYRLAPGQTQATSFQLPEGFDFLSPGLAVDPAGNAYVPMNQMSYGRGHTGENYILKVTPAGEMAPFVGQPGDGGGFKDGTGTEARFRRPAGLAFDGAGNLFVADRGNLSIRRVTPDGVVTTVAGKGAPQLPPSPMPGMPAPDLGPYYEGTVPVAGLTVDRAGTLYFTGTDNRLYRISQDGVQSWLAGDGKSCVGPQACADVCPTPEPDPCDRDGAASFARFLRPTTIHADRSGRLYVLDTATTGGSRIRLVE